MCTQTHVRHTRTLLKSSSASCNLSHTINRADAVLKPLGPVKSLSLCVVRPACACVWLATVPIYVQEGRLWACTNAHPSVHRQEDQGTHVSMDGEAACVPVCGYGHCYCPMGETHFRICLTDGGSH